MSTSKPYPWHPKAGDVYLAPRGALELVVLEVGRDTVCYHVVDTKTKQVLGGRIVTKGAWCRGDILSPSEITEGSV